MIDEALFKSNYLGKDGFIWWLGQVAPGEYWDIKDKTSIDYENNKDAWAFRCKVRIIGYHTFDTTQLDHKDLPWAHIMLGPTDGNSQGGLGKTHKIIGGETVFGFFLDGEDAQQPVIVGALHRNANVESFDIDEVAFKPFSGAKYGRVKQGPTKFSNTKTSQNPTQSVNPGDNIIGGQMKPPVGVGVSSSNSSDKLFPCDKALQEAYRRASSVEIVSENGCDNNIIGKITRAIKDFIAVVNGIQGYLDTYVDPVLNVFVDIANEIKRTARIIVGAVKFIINNMRNIISKMIGCLFSKFKALVISIPEQQIFGEGAKNILNIIFCIFEKIIDRLFPFLEDILQGLVGRALNAPLCAIEEVTATILNKLIDIIDELLEPVLSGIDWLLGGISQINSILSRATSIATELFNLIGCDNLKCKTPSKWALNFGPSMSEYDDWNRVVNKMNVIRGFNDNLDTAVNSLSIFGGGNNPIFRDCADRVNNPSSQGDLVDTGNRALICIPPEIEIFGDGVGASAIPVVGDNGSILSIEVLTQGFGYTEPPSVNIIDKSNYGFGAKAEAIISNGKVTQIYLISPGSGYCKTNLSVLFRKPYYIITANKYSFYEGETCTFTITTENITDGTILSYYLSGDINGEDIENEIEGTITIFNNTAEVSIQVKQDNVVENLEELVFNLLDTTNSLVARARVLVNDKISPILVPETAGSTESPLGTTIPIGITTSFTSGISTFFQREFFSGIGTNFTGIITSIVISNPGLGYTSGDTIGIGTFNNIKIIPNDNGSVISIGSTLLPSQPTNIEDNIVTPNFGEGDGIGTGSVTLPNQGGTGSVTLPNQGGTGSFTSPNQGGTGSFTLPGNVTFPGSTNIPVETTNVPVIPITGELSNIEFSTLPEATINTNTGQGAVVYPIIRYIPKVNFVPEISINDKGILKIVDCV